MEALAHLDDGRGADRFRQALMDAWGAEKIVDWADPIGSAAQGAAWPAAEQDRTIVERLPFSIVLHAERTKTAAGQAGTAGARVACLSLPARR